MKNEKFLSRLSFVFAKPTTFGDGHRQPLNQKHPPLGLRRRPTELGALVFVALALTACGTTIPPLIESTTASYDGRDLNSGVIALVPGGQIVTPHWRARYNAMIALYGSRFAPALQPDDGISPNGLGGPNYFIDSQHAVQFDEMNEWRKAAVVTPNASASKPITPAQ